MRPINGYETYQITEDGRIWYTTRRRWLIPRSWDNGYQRVSLNHSGSNRSFYVHRLVLEAFVGPCPEGMECCHNNGIRTDNRLENLRWDTRSENMRDAARHGTCPGQVSRFGETNAAAKLTADQVELIRAAYADGLGTQQDFADMFGVSRSTIGMMLRGDNWPAVPPVPAQSAQTGPSATKNATKIPQIPRVGG